MGEGLASGGRTVELTEALRLVSKLGEMMQREPISIRDTKRLPVSKEEMKAALKLLWSTLQTPDQRHHVEIAYLSLAYFQDGVGDTSISPALPPNATPQEATELLRPFQEWSDKVRTEGDTLMREIEALRISGAKEESASE
jgi:hypothetical protein